MKDKIRGMLVGLAVGDAIGAPVEFGYSSDFIREEMQRLAHYHENLAMPKGVWTDDTSMALCLADSLIEKKGYDSYDIMDKYSAWEFSGYRSFFPMGFGVGLHTDEAICEYAENPVISKDKPETESIANGCLMRLAPIIMANTEASVQDVLELAKLSCWETHNSTGAMATGELLAATLWLILKGEVSKEELLEESIKLVKDEKLRGFLDEVSDLHTRINDKKGDSLCDLGGYAVDCYDIAMWGLMNFDTFHYGLLGVISLGGDTDTNGAVYGQLAGAYYGYDKILPEWRDEIYLADELVKVSDELLKLKKTPILRTRFEGERHFRAPE